LAVVDLKTAVPDKVAIAKVPTKIAAYYKIVPVAFKDRVLTVAVSYPLDVKIQDEIRTQLGYDIVLALAPEAEVAEAFKKYYGLGAETLEGISAQAPGSGERASSLADLQEKIEDIEKLATDASVIKLVNQIILEAYRRRATDIHIEPYRGGVALRYRVDGILYDAVVPAEIKN
jgi:type II secretory ATPase GspE/PulE/Tfp pilus assembly ATPase PilB-like protein